MSRRVMGTNTDRINKFFEGLNKSVEVLLPHVEFDRSMGNVYTFHTYFFLLLALAKLYKSEKIQADLKTKLITDILTEVSSVLKAHNVFGE